MNTEVVDKKKVPRPPVIVVMGHIDHGKSTLLDYIRKSNVVDKEAGGITQHLSAYEVIHKTEDGINKKITFLDTPGHEAFSAMRSRGALAADIAILVVSAEDSVKAQTLEAWNTIVENKLPYIVAINKIDRPNANIEKTKMDLAEKGVYLEGFGGDVPYAEISAKAGTNISHLLDLILILAELHEVTYDETIPASGIVIESHLDTKRGISATLLIRNGMLSKGMFVAVDGASVTTRIIENFLGKQIDSATCSSPIQLVGFDSQPRVGALFESVSSKKELTELMKLYQSTKLTAVKVKTETQNEQGDIKIIPLVIKTDVLGTCEAVVKEVRKLELDNVKFKILSESVGDFTEGDIKLASSDKETILIGFNVKLEPRARDLNEKEHCTVVTFDIIYKIADYLKEEVEKRRPRKEVVETTGQAKILKKFGATKDKQVIGGVVLTGMIHANTTVRVLRREFEIGQAKIIELQHNKLKVKEVNEGDQFGLQIESKIEVAEGDVLEAFRMVVE